MADLAASDVTITVERVGREGRYRRNRIKIVFGNGTLTYPTGGVPLPTDVNKYGLVQRLDYIKLTDQDDSSGIIWKYDQANNKLRAYVQGAAHAAGGAATLDDYAVTAGFGVSSGISIAREASAGAVTSRWGPLKEAVGGTDAPAAHTMYGEAVGF